MGCGGQPVSSDPRISSTRASLDAGLRWLGDSGLWEGGQFRWGWRSGRFGFVYTEATAYGLLLLLRLGRSGDQVVSAARSLMSLQHPSGAFLHSPGADDAFTFDTAICVAALAELASRNDDTACRDAALRGARWLLTAQKPTGSFHARYVPSKAVFDQGTGAGTFWGDDSPIHAKVSLALLRCELLSPGEGFLPAAVQVCDWTTSLQLPDGRIRQCASSEETFLHAHCYATEGLLATAQVSPHPHLRDAAEAGLSWLEGVQRRDGAIPAWRPGWRRPTMSASDATAQAVRLWLASDDAPALMPRVRRAVRHLLRVQTRSGPRETVGSFCAASYGLWPALHRTPVFPAWTTMFAVHALHVFARHIEGHRSSPRELF